MPNAFGCQTPNVSNGNPVLESGAARKGPGVLMRNGIHKGDLTPGTKVTVIGHPMKNGQTAASWIKAVRGDGVMFDPRLRPSDGPPGSGNDTPSPQ